MGRMETVATAILGVWLGVTLFMWFAAVRSFSTVDRVLREPNPQFREATKPLGQNQTREVLRHLASEVNRTFFSAYNWVQVLLGTLLLFLLWRQVPQDRMALALGGTMLGLVLVLLLFVTPQIIVLGRRLDFVPRTSPLPEMTRFRMLHAAYTGLDGLKLLTGLGLLLRWVLYRTH